MALPDASRPRPAAFVLATDLYTRNGVCVGVQGTAPSRRYVVEWIDNSECCSTVAAQGHYTFEMVMNEADNSIDYIYQTVTIPTLNSPHTFLSGVQNVDGTAGSTLEFSPSSGPTAAMAGLSYHFAPYP